ncbi:hypothetical protein NMY22_g10234 [Coprinellus aureogranulatus]|nr:hypothetical protein NMY22_g10234 [Coprinellus aureogranulatus]
MPRRALSKTKKAQLDGAKLDILYARAVSLYQYEHSLPPPHKPLGLRPVCDKIAADYARETKNKYHVHLNHGTLSSLVKGGMNIRQFNSEKQWLTPEETEQLIAVLLELADWGQPCSYSRLRELANEILRARLGSKFPKGGVGTEWPYRFVERHSDRLHRYKAKGLDDVRARAVNETANEHWFDLVEEVQLRGDDGEPVAPECTFAMDEAGFQPNGTEGFEVVIGARGQKLQYQQRKGSRENITVCVAIGADGTALQPLVLYSGTAFLEKWHQDNPSKASLGYSKKGWTDNELGLEFLKDFDRQTRDIAAGRTRVLYIDGHGSHLTFEFIQYCRLNKIKVPKYIPHGTHVYQGLDVVCFGPVKQDFGRRRDALLRETGQHITKENFLTIYGQTHLHVLTPSLIKTAFRKTGIVPVDRTVITPDKLAPSKESSHEVITPVVPPTPVRIMTDYILDALPLASLPEESDTPPDSPTPSHANTSLPRTAIETRTHIAMNELRGTSAGFLFESTPIESTAEPPDLPAIPISPVKKGKGQDSVEDLLVQESDNPLVKGLQRALEEERAKSAFYKRQTINLQSAMVLQRVYCRKLRLQLKVKEEKSKKRSNRKLKKAGLGRVITDDDFFKEVTEQREAEKAEERLKELRKSAQERHAEAVEAWEAEESKRVEKNDQRKEEWERAKVLWEEQKEEAKAAGTKVKDWVATHPKPKRADPAYCIIPRPPKPTLAQFLEEREDESSENEDEGGDEESEADEA